MAMTPPLRLDIDAESKILIIDDDRAALDALRRMLRRAGYRQIISTSDPRDALQLCLWRSPDLILLDLHMPYLDGEGLLARIRAETPVEHQVPVIVLTGDVTRAAKRRAFLAGAQDYMTKPYHREEVLLRIRTQLATLGLQRELRSRAVELEAAVRERTGDLERTQIELLDRLARAAEYRDDDTGEHAERVGRLAAQIAAELGVAPERVELIWRAAALHDVGKIGISDDILLKPGKLSPEEMARMREHVSIGAAILGGGSSKYLQIAERIALTHHEWWDGNGYLGLAGEDIPLEGRIVAVADVFDALTSDRPYKSAWSRGDAIEHILRLSGTHFDPAVVSAFTQIIRRSEPPLLEAASV